MRTIVFVAGLALLAVPAFADPAPVTMILNPDQQSGLSSLCVIALRSPSVDANTTLTVAEFCADLRARIAKAPHAAPAKPVEPAPPKPEEPHGPPVE